MKPHVIALRTAYRASGLTIGQVAARAGVSENTACSLLSGRTVRTTTLFRVCRVLGVPTVPVPNDQDERRTP